MGRFFLLLVLCLGLVSFAQAAEPAEGRPSFILHDIPLMPGLSPESDEDLIVLMGPRQNENEAQATGLVDVDEVYYYYESTLPPLGWRYVSPRLYERNGRVLNIDASSANPNGSTLVRFSLESGP
jgi:hypothetical protein